jgi:predicted DNA-binding transcriptional regulator AlpA
VNRLHPKQLGNKMTQDTNQSPLVKPTIFRITDLSSSPKKQGFLPVSAATIWRWVLEGKFPKPFKLGEKTTVWHIAEVESWIEHQKQTTENRPPRKQTK